MSEYKINDVDFFAEANLTEPARTDAEAYLIDGQPAYSTLEKGNRAEVTVKNPLGIQYQFVPIDYNIVIRRDNGEMESTCDGMIHYGEKRNVIFVELKDRSGKDWISKAVGQLGKTIEIFSRKHPYTSLGKKRAYAANRQHMPYHVSSSNRDLCDTFRNKFHYGLCICGTIDIR